MTSFLRTRKDRHPKSENKARLPHEHDQSADSQRSDVGQKEIRRAYEDIRDGQVDTDLRGSGGLDEVNKDAGKRAGEAPHKTGDETFDKSH
ncbi:hypothetical protein [Herbaspirillum sp. RV1423]|uniref:hypothetical protein n=1 Tax=Herbaspirillum sp. RV1423 TaxID=1443993 RepID=UPI0004BC22A6|nr:hypothetical protein [Herbaspirillum sp. RV1423]